MNTLLSFFFKVILEHLDFWFPIMTILKEKRIMKHDTSETHYKMHEILWVFIIYILHIISD